MGDENITDRVRLMDKIWLGCETRKYLLVTGLAMMYLSDIFERDSQLAGARSMAQDFTDTSRLMADIGIPVGLSVVGVALGMAGYYLAKRYHQRRE